MTFLGGGERLCCESIRTLSARGHEVTLISSEFEPSRVESFFGYQGLFKKIGLRLYPIDDKTRFGTASNILRHYQGQQRVMSEYSFKDFDIVFSTQDPGYISDDRWPVVQWGYFPRRFKYSHSVPKELRSLPLRVHYGLRISRIGLVLAISNYSKSHLDVEWNRPTVLVYPPCNMVPSRVKRDLVITAARAVPEKRLELFWNVARLLPQYEFAMLLTKESQHLNYFENLRKQMPENGKIITNPLKEEYHRILGEAKVYLHLMPGEHFGITVVEAMSAGCTPIVHDSGGPAEIVGSEFGFRWRETEKIPMMITEAMKKSDSEEVRRRAEDFSVERFDDRLSAIFSGLRVESQQRDRVRCLSAT